MSAIYNIVQGGVKRIARLTGLRTEEKVQQTVMQDGVCYVIDDVEGSTCYVKKVLDKGCREFRFRPTIQWVGREYRVTEFRAFCFADCTRLERVVVDSIESWCSLKFENASANPLSIAGRLFYKGEEVHELLFPDGLKSIGYECFYGCTSLTRVVVPDSVTEIGGACFTGCRNLQSVRLSSSLKALGEGLFDECSSLTDIVLPDGLEVIDKNCFRGCTSLSVVQLPHSVKLLADRCFAGCEAICSLELPTSLEHIGCNCFNGCVNLSEMTSNAERVPDSGTGYNPFEGMHYRRHGKLFVPADSVERYAEADYWKEWSQIIPVE